MGEAANSCDHCITSHYYFKAFCQRVELDQRSKTEKTKQNKTNKKKTNKNKSDMMVLKLGTRKVQRKVEIACAVCLVVFFLFSCCASFCLVFVSGSLAAVWMVERIDLMPKGLMSM